ncbi:MAG: hypothetical protein MUP21_03665 [Dehalococcoidia bacterium]|nr:hypothetical protein [Dehalococcoidia bacterium]
MLLYLGSHYFNEFLGIAHVIPDFGHMFNVIDPIYHVVYIQRRAIGPILIDNVSICLVLYIKYFKYQLAACEFICKVGLHCVLHGVAGPLTTVTAICPVKVHDFNVVTSTVAWLN